ncbi:O-antigen polymerase [Parabacteroides goldsteinii]|uniref:O-antigen polymerase n=1 Tax=Parabacteroides goldsteinii TaxID=328812 RepID=UPI002430C769|nr:O-antigen ligase [Parabacteroides goldsteinii]
MSYYITILFLLLTLFLTRRIDKCLIHPITLTSSLWLFLLIGYNVIDHGLYPLSDKFYYALMAWIIPFQIACLSMSNKYVRVRRLHLAHSATPLITNRYVILFISICLIISLVMSYQRAIVFDPSNFYSAWRELFVAVKRNEEAPLSGLHLNTFRVAQMGYMFCLIYLLRDERFKYKRLFFLLVFAFIVMGADKGSILRFFIGYIGVLCFRNKLNVRILLYSLSLICLVVYAIQFFRGDSEGIDIFDLIYIYIFSPLPAFDNYILHSQVDLTTYFHGDLVFKNFPLVGRIFANNYNTVDVNYFNYEMVHVPLPTNVYTMMAGYWVGWKWLGLIVGGLFHGCFWGYVYNRSRKSEAYKVLYVSILNVLVFYFFHM